MIERQTLTSIRHKGRQAGRLAIRAGGERGVVDSRRSARVGADGLRHESADLSVAPSGRFDRPLGRGCRQPGPRCAFSPTAPG
jgi:hypothetical protein